MKINYCPPRIAEVKALEVTGLSGVVDLAPLIKSGSFWARLREDDDMFKQVQIMGNTICWPDESDIAPERIWEGVMAANAELAHTG